MPYAEIQSQKDSDFWNNESVYTLTSLPVSSYCLLEQSSDVCTAADLSKWWFFMNLLGNSMSLSIPNLPNPWSVPLAHVGEATEWLPFLEPCTGSWQVGSRSWALAWDKATNSPILLLQLANRLPPCFQRAADSPDCSCPNTVPCSPKHSFEDSSTLQPLNWTKRNAVP